MQRRADYRVYILRLWRVNDGPNAIWRASLLEVHTGVRRGFAGLGDAITHLRAEIANARTATDLAANDVAPT
jgi:hypothetical protein